MSYFSIGVPLGALMHLAGVLADGVLPSLTLESLERSYAPKASGVGVAMRETMGWK